MIGHDVLAGPQERMQELVLGRIRGLRKIVLGFIKIYLRDLFFEDGGGEALVDKVRIVDHRLVFRHDCPTGLDHLDQQVGDFMFAGRVDGRDAQQDSTSKQT
jgi:hypothetical protein